jgi:hypothetical protein
MVITGMFSFIVRLPITCLCRLLQDKRAMKVGLDMALNFRDLVNKDIALGTDMIQVGG